MLQSIGSDMELFAKNKEGKHIALCGLIGGTKEQPQQLEGLPDGFMVQEDNVAFEFNIPVCYNKLEFIRSFNVMRTRTANILKELKLTPSKNASVSFDEGELVHPNALVFGCEPDYNAWSMCENSKPVTDDKTLRTCGGHIHVGSPIDMVAGVRNMDLFLGVPSVIIDTSPSSLARRKLYGKAGAMRPKNYGFEYRTLSNFWMFNTKLVGWVYEQTKAACNFGNNLSDDVGVIIQDCINTGNKDLAVELINKYSIKLPV